MELELALFSAFHFHFRTGWVSRYSKVENCINFYDAEITIFLATFNTVVPLPRLSLCSQNNSLTFQICISYFFKTYTGKLHTPTLNKLDMSLINQSVGIIDFFVLQKYWYLGWNPFWHYGIMMKENIADRHLCFSVWIFWYYLKLTLFLHPTYEVHIFWEGHNILRNLQTTFVCI